MFEVPLQAIDNVMLEFHMGHILVGTFVLVILGSLPLKSMKILGLNVILFGAIFLLTPVDMAGNDITYRLLGAGLLIAGPILYVAGSD